MSQTSKSLSKRDEEQTLRGAYNDVNATLGVDGFLVGKIGHKIEMALATTSVVDDTEVFSFYDGATLLYEITAIYTDGTRAVFLSAERTA